MNPGRSRAFTLIELLVVISIIGLLSSVALASLNTAREKARLSSAKQFASGLYRAVGDEPVALIDFDECSGLIAADRSGNSNSGSVNGAPSWPTDTPFNIGCAMSFNGSTQYVDLGDTSAFDFSNSTSFTISAWVRLATVSGNMRIMSNGHSGWTNGWLFFPYYQSGGVLSGIGAGGVQANSLLFQSTNLISTGRWTHLAVVYDQSAKIARMYIDGQQVNITKYSSTCGTVVNSKDLDYSACTSISTVHTMNTNIGRRATGGEYFSGSLDNVYVFKKALTADQIGKLYAYDSAKFGFLEPAAAH